MVPNTAAHHYVCTTWGHLWQQCTTNDPQISSDANTQVVISLQVDDTSEMVTAPTFYPVCTSDLAGNSTCAWAGLYMACHIDIVYAVHDNIMLLITACISSLARPLLAYMTACKASRALHIFSASKQGVPHLL
jgi:hypothetical protein